MKRRKCSCCSRHTKRADHFCGLHRNAFEQWIERENVGTFADFCERRVRPVEEALTAAEGSSTS